MPNIVVLGAGVSGLTTALLLSRNPKYKVTIIAKHMPGDYDIEYTSMWAGANYAPMASQLDSKWEKNTWPELARLAKDVPEAGIHFQNCKNYYRKKYVDSQVNDWSKALASATPWYKDLFPDFKVLPKEDLAPGIERATSFTSVCINTPVYLSWLVGQCLKQGCILERAVVAHISDAGKLHRSGKQADLVVNCTGLLSSKLGGVMDKDVIPARGQIVVVRNDPGEMFSLSGADDGGEELCYIMTRAGGGGTILGGTYQKGNWESQPDPNTALRIMKRAVALCPALTDGKGIEALSVIRHGVGLRPLRQSGVRIEKERIGETWVVHNYGHAGWGYQGSYGSASGAVRLVDEVFGAEAKL